jgi:N-acetylmuramoyl-L-alanine amidase
MNIDCIDDLLSYHDRLDARDPATIDLVVIHCTELPDLAVAREYAERVHYPESRTGNAGHYYIDRDGSVQCWVQTTRVAHHVRGHNPRSIGIELVNTGRWPNWLDSRRQDMTEPYPTAQIDALIGLMGCLVAETPTLTWVAGHEELDREQVPASDDPKRSVCRKRDPGPLFPWGRVLDHCGLERLPAEPRP